MNSPPEDRLLLVWLGSGTQTGSSPPRASAPTLRGERPEIQPEKVEDNRAARTGKNQSGRNGGARDIQMYRVFSGRKFEASKGLRDKSIL